MKNTTTRYEFMRALDFLTLFGLFVMIILFVNSTLDLIMSFNSEFYTTMFANLKYPGI